MRYLLAEKGLAYANAAKGFPTYTSTIEEEVEPALILCIPLVPCEAGILIAERRRLHWSWRSIIVPRGDRGVSITDGRSGGDAPLAFGYDAADRLIEVVGGSVTRRALAGFVAFQHIGALRIVI